ncbi:MAG TPA: thrombospondin type 3 repeat-containing protein, partial [Polyangia bacterium]
MRRAPRLSTALLIAWSVPAVAVAQTTTDHVAIQQYQPSPFSERMLRLDGSGVAPFGALRVGLDVDYALRPLVLVDQTPGIFQAGAVGPDHNLVEHAVGGALLASFGLGHRLELGLAVPLVLFQTGASVPGVPKPTATGLGNPLVGLKAHFGSWRGLGAGASVTASLPAGSGSLTHENGFGGNARLFADYRRGPLTIGARGGYQLRGAQTFYGVGIGDTIDYAAGASVGLGLRTVVMAELAGATAAKNPFADRDQSPLEALAGLRQRIGKLYLTLAGGPGLVHGYGSPVFRAVAGLAWANRVPDADGDGVSDDDDLCPTVPEDRDGFEDTDGCPDPDNDRDGIPDAADKCPDQPEDKDGFEDQDGCPDPDNDKDGIPDVDDRCPNDPE